MRLISKKKQILSLIIILFLFLTIFYINSINLEIDNPNKTIVDKEKINQSLKLSKNWLINNLNSEGYFNYIYDPIDDEYSSKNNMIRQLMASRVISELANENDSLKIINKKNLEYIFSNWYKEKDDLGYIYFDSKSKLGAIAMMLRTLVYSPYFENYSLQAQKLANTIIYLQNSDGSFEPWYIEPDYTYDKDYLLTFYSGEAILSLLDYYEKTEKNYILSSAIKSQDFYIKKYVENLTENYYPAYVPWHTQSLSKLYMITENKSYSNLIFILNDELLKLQDTKNNNTLGRFYNKSTPEYGSPHSSSDAVYTEGLSYAYEIAEMLNDENHKEKYLKAIVIGSENLINLQYNKTNSKNFKDPEKIIGAIKINIDRSDIRVDTTQHTIDAFDKIIKVF